MFPQMRRSRQQLSTIETEEILHKGNTGILALTGMESYPYAVPLNYVYLNGNIYIHCAISGYKLDCIQKNNHVCFCIVDQDTVIPDIFSTNYRSAIVFGTASIISDDVIRRQALEGLIQKYCADFIQSGQQEIEKDWEKTAIIEITIEHVTAKSASQAVQNHNPS